jgi:hypothetical protein
MQVFKADRRLQLPEVVKVGDDVGVLAPLVGAAVGTPTEVGANVGDAVGTEAEYEVRQFDVEPWSVSSAELTYTSTVITDILDATVGARVGLSVGTAVGEYVGVSVYPAIASAVISVPPMAPQLKEE